MQILIFLVILLEGFAAISGLYYYKKKPTDKAVGFFAYFLLLTYFIEIIGTIPTIIYWNEPLHYLKGTFWYQNFWLHNPYLIISFVVYILYFYWNISNKKIIELEIPTGNPLSIKFGNGAKVEDCKYLDNERSKKILFSN